MTRRNNLAVWVSKPWVYIYERPGVRRLATHSALKLCLSFRASRVVNFELKLKADFEPAVRASVSSYYPLASGLEHEAATALPRQLFLGPLSPATVTQQVIVFRI